MTLPAHPSTNSTVSLFLAPKIAFLSSSSTKVTGLSSSSTGSHRADHSAISPATMLGSSRTRVEAVTVPATAA